MKRHRGFAVILLLACLGLSLPAAARAAFKHGVTGASATKLDLQSNQSFLLDTTLDIRRVSIGKPEIADVTVVTPKQLMVTGKAPGETTLIYWTAAGVPTSVDVSVWVDSGVRKGLEKIVPGEKFEMSGTPETMILTGSVSSETAQHRLVESAKAYTKNVVNLLAVERVEQVMLQVRVAEVDRKTVKELGFNFLVDGNNTLRGASSPANPFTNFFGDLRNTDLEQGRAEHLLQRRGEPLRREAGDVPQVRRLHPRPERPGRHEGPRGAEPDRGQRGGREVPRGGRVPRRLQHVERRDRRDHA